jgi:YfiH family protein
MDINNLKMERARREDVITIARLELIPDLVHGFGTKDWKDKDLRKRPEWERFRFIFLNQVHSDIIRFIDRVPEKELRGDAMVTGLPSLLLIIKTADCLPVLVVDESRRVIAAVHCGWRGTSKGVVKRAIQSMVAHFGCRPVDLLVGLGPCIESDCYEVGEDVFQAFKREGLKTKFFRDHPSGKGKYLFDLKGENLSQLVSAGVDEKNIYSADCCTYCDNNLPSFRREKERAGRMLSFIGMK